MQDTELHIQNRTVRILSSEEDLIKVKELDDLAFEVDKNIPGIIAITLNELKNVANNGAVLGVYESDILVAESLVLTSSIPTHKEIETDEAFCYGTAIHPDFRGSGLSSVMYEAQETIAMRAGKLRTLLTARVENPASIRARLKMGYTITGYDATFYGPIEKGGSRMFLSKTLSRPAVFNPKALITDVNTGAIQIISEITDQLSKKVAVLVTPGYSVDFPAHRVISKLISLGYVGNGLLKASEIENYKRENEAKVLIIFSNS